MTQSLLLTLPEIVLTLAGLALMMAAAWMGDRSARLLTWIAIAALVGACFAVPGISGRGGIAFDGLFVGDGFA
ncbi:MAG TPA: NADH-quinone oxidoreductase subunit N, partial [Allosphingosinicella sp.]|nr:NADH-quinone oxidoreductase subunit N [Allosphingosinicella sp.]